MEWILNILSKIDTAKAIGIIIKNPEFSDVRSLEGAVETKNKSVDIIAVSTTAATGMGFSNIGLGLVHGMAHPFGAFSSYAFLDIIIILMSIYLYSHLVIFTIYKEKYTIKYKFIKNSNDGKR